MRRTIQYPTKTVFAGPSPATGRHFIDSNGDTSNYTGDLNAVNELFRVQSQSITYSLNKKQVYQYGELAAIDEVAVETPTAEFSCSYILANFENEKSIGFDVNNFRSCMSGMLASDTDDRNYFLKIVPEGNDSIDGTSFYGDNIDVIGIGNAVLTSYSTRCSVGSVPTASFSAEGINVVFDQGTTGNVVPAINYITNERIDSYYTLPIPSGSAELSGNLGQSVIRPSDIFVKIYQAGTGVAQNNIDAFPDDYNTFGPDIKQIGIQGYELAIDIPRESIERLGSRFHCARKIKPPIPVTLTLDTLFQETTTGDLAEIFQCDNSYKVDIRLYKEACTGTLLERDILARYELSNAKLDRVSVNSSIGNNKQVSFDFVGQIGGPSQINKGLILNDITFVEPAAAEAGPTAAQLLCAFTGDDGYFSAITMTGLVTGGIDTCDCYDTGQLEPSGSFVAIHSGWVDGLEYRNNYSGVIGEETYDGYPTGEGTGDYNSGVGFEDSWVFEDSYIKMAASGNFETLSTGVTNDNTDASGNALNEGFGWVTGFAVS